MKKKSFRSYFPIFKHHPEIVYFDSAATTLKPKKMIDSLNEFYCSNGIGIKSSGILSTKSEISLIKARQKTAYFINADEKEIIFTKGATDSLNIIAQILKDKINMDDEIITCELEHHSSLIPWINIVRQKKAKLRFIPLDEKNQISVGNFKKVLSNRTKIVFLTHVSNVLGCQTPIETITKLAHEKKALVILDVAQSISYQKIDVKTLDVDFLAFSAHKMYGPFGVGVLFGKQKILEELMPCNFGGSATQEAFFDNFVLSPLPYKFEPGTPNIGGIMAFSKSLEFIEEIGLKNIYEYKKFLGIEMINRLKKVSNITIYNPESFSVFIFNLKNIHSHDVDSFLAKKNIYGRSGQHCASLVSKKIQQISTLRVSVDIYNNIEDIDKLVESLKYINYFFNQ